MSKCQNAIAMNKLKFIHIGTLLASRKRFDNHRFRRRADRTNGEHEK
jgi:hypothetical protein